ncbi:glycosyltransferase family 2 protein [Thermoanaerobacterium sp. RBIITD]|uniref:glycosyltransferase family 2 protein n=1 Tax=Thermoanaerobacterium sp. RBIITD TaxID=1550240 RepID=UPI000BB7A6BE|nr:glycosyltransferase family 2 protein [Thermoanaerobacterium sp. RBIITD]SNX55480.1 Glycosyltransferase involved in cell wall bisynthesis [Thermoanaerobacterium sp. RBIITD]
MISVIVPAYNEEKNIKNVLCILEHIDVIGEIIVVNDGSTDNTAKVASNFNVTIVNQEKNMGKGAAIKIGIQKSIGDIIVMLDADLVGLTENHFKKLVEPILDNNADMTIGIFSSGRKTTDWAQKIAPFLSGQRAMKKKLFMEFIEEKNIDVCKYGLEVALTKYAKSKKLRVQHVPFENMTHIMKEEKLGLIRGFYSRLKMYRDILKVWI